MDETREVATGQSLRLDVPQNARGCVYPAWIATGRDALKNIYRYKE